MVNGSIAVAAMPYSQHAIHKGLKDDEAFVAGNLSHPYSPAYDSAFARAEHIWMYGWLLPASQDSLNRRGMVEEWKFRTPEDAKYCFEFLQAELRHIGFPFCKAGPGYVLCNERLYLFHSDHSGVSNRNRRFQRWIEDRCQ